MTTRPVVIVQSALLIMPWMMQRPAHGGQTEDLLHVVRQYADNVLMYGRDVYGPRQTPLLVDGLNIETRQPFRWMHKSKEHVVSDVASQQVLFRVFDGLSRLTGDGKYHQVAVDVVRYAFDHFQHPPGLIDWGGHRAVDLITDEPFGYTPASHELKAHYPYYELMWEVDPNATRRFIEAFWNAHVIDWSNLDFNRHGYFDKKMGALWRNEYRGGPVFFLGAGLTFINTGSDLIYAGGVLSRFTGQAEPRVWAERLANRYVETRDPNTGLGGYQFSRIKGEGDRAYAQMGQEFGDQAYEGKLIVEYYPALRYGRFAICQMRLSEMLGPDGADFRTWAHEDLAAFSKHVYNPKDNRIYPMFTSGRSLAGYALQRNGYYGPKGHVFKPAVAGGLFLRTYAMAWRLTGDPLMWETARQIGLGNRLGDIGATPGAPPALNLETDCFDADVIFALLELHEKRGDRAYLDLGGRIAQNIIDNGFVKGFFVPSARHAYAKFDAAEPLALLHVVGAMMGKRREVPGDAAGQSHFAAVLDGKGSVYDTDYVYSMKRR